MMNTYDHMAQGGKVIIWDCYREYLCTMDQRWRWVLTTGMHYKRKRVRALHLQAW